MVRGNKFLFYTVDEVADMYGVRPNTVRTWAIEGRIRAIKTLGGHWRFPKDWVDRELNESSNQIQDYRPASGL